MSIISRSRTREPSHSPMPTCQESLTKHNASKEKRKRDQHLSQEHKTDSRQPRALSNLQPPPSPTIQNPHLIQSGEETLQDLDKRVEIRLGNIVTSTVQDHNLDITKILIVQINMLRFQQ